MCTSGISCVNLILDVFQNSHVLFQQCKRKAYCSAYRKDVEAQPERTKVYSSFALSSISYGLLTCAWAFLQGAGAGPAQLLAACVAIRQPLEARAPYRPSDISLPPLAKHYRHSTRCLHVSSCRALVPAAWAAVVRQPLEARA